MATRTTVALGPRRPSGTSRSRVAITRRACIALRALRTSRAIRTLRPNGPGRTNGTSRALRTSRTLRPRGAGRRTAVDDIGGLPVTDVAGRVVG
jgi:hypothetical protein